MSTDKKKPIRAQFGANDSRNPYLRYGIVSNDPKDQVSVFVNMRAITKSLGNYKERLGYVKTCPVCKGATPMHMGASQIKHDIARMDVSMTRDYAHVVKHNGQTCLLLTCGTACHELYGINPLAYDLDKLYGK